jgi:PKD repeat protein
MGKQTFDRIKKTLAILLVVLFVATLTAASVSAQPRAKIDSAQTTSYTVSFSSEGSTTDGVTYLWDFGDGMTSNAVNPVHVYDDTDNTGQHTVTLTVTDSDGVFDKDTKENV